MTAWLDSLVVRERKRKRKREREKEREKERIRRTGSRDRQIARHIKNSIVS